MNKKFNAAEEINLYSSLFNRMCYNLLKEPLFQSFGLELSAASIRLETNDNFALIGKTFAYFNPIDQSIHVNIQDPFFTYCNNDVERKAKLCFILFHEMYHKVLKHDTRSAQREHTLWNIAADCEVHNMMYLYKECCVNNNNSYLVNEFKLIEAMLDKANNKNFEPDTEHGEYAFMFDKSYLNNIAEEIYAALLNSKKVEQQSFQVNLDSLMNGGNSQNQSGQDGEGDGENESDNKSGQGEDTDTDSDNNANNSNGKNKKQANSKQQGQGQQKQGKKVAGQSSGNSNGQSGNGPTVTVTKTTYELPNGRKFTDISINWPDNESLPDGMKKTKEQQARDAENAELRRQVMEQNLKNEVERNKGNMSSECNTFLKKLFKVKIDWEKILKTSLQTVLTKSDYFSWARPRRTTMALDLPYLPDLVEDNNGYGKIFICVDQSGSMTDKEFQKIGNIILDAKEHYKKIVVIQHDTDINNVFEFDDINEETLKHVFTRTSNGGTSHHAVFEYIAKDWVETKFDDENKISAVIVCSDCCSDIQDEQKKLSGEIPMIYLVPEHCQEYTRDIRGKVIEVE